MAVPNRKISKSRRNKRLAQWKLKRPALAECPQCHELMMPHRICKSCGYYKGKEALKVE
ncbi:MAG: 50S ribosomal protein L32 [Bacillota bacterium]|nr:50S ribosomal protein L32 [Bacillota bacterium]MDD3297505.1 50S ribosomal protein L32 [Bacillota bacterium]MDD3851071.1 50S ribosomal protein L32 [Bacillota bacterium]MDD4706901.1 50S ribosomal protein L32 [Bacillota bacterium]